MASHVSDLVKSLFVSGDYSDLEIKCENKTYHVHKSIVCPQVPFIAGAVRFAAASGEEKKSIDLSKDDSSAVQAMLEYLYTDDYHPHISSTPEPHTCPNYGWGRCCYMKVCEHHTCSFQTCDHSCRNFQCPECLNHRDIPSSTSKHLFLHIKVYHLADMYQVTDLMKLSNEKFAIACRKFWNSQDFVVAAQHAAAVGKDLDETLISTVADHMKLLENAGIKALFEEYGRLSMGILCLHSKVLGWNK